jgi:hypothetical protein
MDHSLSVSNAQESCLAASEESGLEKIAVMPTIPKKPETPARATAAGT